MSINLSDLSSDSELFNRHSDVSIFRAIHNITKRFYCVKKISNAINEKNLYLFLNLSHPNIMTLFNIEIQEENCSIFIIAEYFPEGTLEHLIQEKKNSGYYWSEIELLKYIIQLLSALIYMKSNKIAHRDINPRNIFLVENASVLKIGGFRSACEVSQNESDIAGNLLFSSPLVRKAYLNMLVGGEDRVIHDPYKSDMYSLGLILYYMTTLTEPKDLKNLYTLESDLNRKIEEIHDSYKTVKQLLRAMLAINQDERIGLEEAKVFLDRFFEGVKKCAGCASEIYENFKYREYILCETCFESISETEKYDCTLCKSKGSKENVYIFDNDFYCHNCLNVDTFESQKLYCKGCRIILDAILECDCGYQRCYICKLDKHRGSCISALGDPKNEYQVNYECDCPQLLEKNAGSYYFFCEAERLYFCIVCCKKTEFAHEACRILLTYGYKLDNAKNS